MGEDLDATRIPKMAPDHAQEIARGLKWLAESYVAAGMARHASKAERDSVWWLAYSVSLAQTREST